MLEIEKPRIECVETNDEQHYGKFVVEPLERGYGITLGNSLRRILLSSLPGAAVTSVKIEGVLHEFSTVPGVKEDVTDIILNLKSLCLKMHTDEERIMRIETQQEGPVTAGDILTDPDVEILNNDMHIATLAEGGRLFMEMTVSKGRGYVSAERNKKVTISLELFRWTLYLLRCARLTTMWIIPEWVSARIMTNLPWKFGRTAVLKLMKLLA